MDQRPDAGVPVTGDTLFCANALVMDRSNMKWPTAAHGMVDVSGTKANAATRSA